MASLFRRSFQVVSRVLKLQPEKHFVGKDFDGNNYYEIPPQRYFLGLAQQSKAKRIAIPPSGTETSMTTFKFTNEWNSWLQHKRDNPPTWEEIQANEIKRATIQHRAENLQVPKPKVQEKTKTPEKDEEQTVESWTDQK
uniref:Mimitin, mitochondrial-like n=1 Tax=Phallusia mammillata TaxID=59560 RepID=A0A6F9DMW3_9ASCI|nr:mimitin, mitochondrial-like [Phallusia mammillata]